jgi:hypothetical protein
VNTEIKICVAKADKTKNKQTILEYKLFTSDMPLPAASEENFTQSQADSIAKVT